MVRTVVRTMCPIAGSCHCRSTRSLRQLELLVVQNAASVKVGQSFEFRARARRGLTGLARDRRGRLSSPRRAAGLAMSDPAAVRSSTLPVVVAAMSADWRSTQHPSRSSQGCSLATGGVVSLARQVQARRRALDGPPPRMRGAPSGARGDAPAGTTQCRSGVRRLRCAIVSVLSGGVEARP